VVDSSAALVRTRLWPHGPLLDVIANGERLPIFGVPEVLSDDDYDAGVEAARRWNPEATSIDEMGRGLRLRFSAPPSFRDG
jgi:hypothetical protein